MVMSHVLVIFFKSLFQYKEDDDKHVAHYHLLSWFNKKSTCGNMSNFLKTN
jgi:hypothetical protein